jgi:hypothetical protein
VRPGETPPEPPEPIARRKAYEDEGEPLPLPECPDPMLVEWLMEAGPVMPSGYGPVGITWTELTSGQQRTGIELQPWEARLMVRLSREFASESIAAGKPNRPAPMEETKPSDAKRAAVDQAVRTSMRAMIAAQKGGGAKKQKRNKPRTPPP